MKVLEKLVLSYTKSVLPKEMDPCQFAYRENRCTGDDAVARTIHRVLSHLEPPSSKSIDANADCRILFVDYRSAFNTIVPEKLYSKLMKLNAIPEPMCK